MAFDTWRDDGEFAIKATDVLKNYQEGGELGACEVHGCEIIGSKKPVLSYPKNEKGEVIGEPYLYLSLIHIFMAAMYIMNDEE